MNKTEALKVALAQIEKAHGKGSVMKLGANQKVAEIDAVSTGSLGLDIALGIGGERGGGRGAAHRLESTPAPG